MICPGPFHPQQFCHSVSHGCSGAGQHTVCWGLSVTVPHSGVGISCLRLLIQPFRLWKGLWVFYSFKANPLSLPCLGWKNSWMKESHLQTHLSPKHAHPTETWEGAGWGSAACSPHSHPVTQQWALIAVPGTLLPAAPLRSRFLSLLACVFWKSEGCCKKSGEQARRLNAQMCLSGKTSGKSPNTLILNT